MRKSALVVCALAAAVLVAGTPAQASSAVDGTTTLSVNVASTTKLANAGISVYAQEPGSSTLTVSGKDNIALPITIVSSSKTVYKHLGSIVLVNGPAQRNLTLGKVWLDTAQGKISAVLTSTSSPSIANGQRVNVFTFEGGTPNSSGLAGAKLYLNPANGVESLLNSVLGTTLFVSHMRVGTATYAVTG